MIINLTKSSRQDPGYLVSGISQQSHWLAENSNVSGVTVTNVVDEFGLENLVQFGVGATYEPNGCGGDNGPSILINGGNLTGNGWATRVAGSLKPFIMTAKIQFVAITNYAVPWGFAISNNSAPNHLGPRKYGSSSSIEIIRMANTSTSSTYWTQMIATPAIDTDRHNWVVEYTGGQHNMWIDGVAVTKSYNKTRYVGYTCNFNSFMIGGWGNLGTRDPSNFRLAELHIYRPYHSTFSTYVRDKLIADLQNRRGT